MFTGLWLHESGALGATPDALVLAPPTTLPVHLQSAAATGLRPALLEVKCPYSARDMSVEQAALTLKGFYISKLFIHDLKMSVLYGTVCTS